MRIESSEAAGDGTIDETWEINGWNTDGPSLSSSYGYGSDVDAIGDVDGDGVVDIVAGAATASAGGLTVFIHFLNADGTAKRTRALDSLSENGAGVSGIYGISVAGIGDLDDDGVPDIAVGAEGDDSGASNAGAVFIHFLNANGTIKSTVELNNATTNGATGLIASDNYGSNVAGIGDLNDDGVEDIAVGARGDDTSGTGAGAVYIHFMNTNGSVDSTVELNGSTPNGATVVNSGDQYASVAGIGDLNGDGVEDIAVGAPNKASDGIYIGGAVFIHFMNTDGSMDSTVSINEDTANGPAIGSNDELGESVALLGDLNNDGVREIGVGADRGGLTTPDCNGVSECGAVYVLYMNTDGSLDSSVMLTGNTTNGATLTASSAYGISLADLGDLNGDGVEDIAVGAQNSDFFALNAGAVFLHFMNTDASMDSTVRFDGTETKGPTSMNTNDAYGEAVENIGDLDNDGIDEVAVGNIGLTAGEVYISFMDADGTPKSTVLIDDTTVNGPTPATSDGYGVDIAALGDLDGDGVEDFAVGAHQDTTATGGSTGAVYIQYLNTDASLDSSVIISGATANGPTLSLGDNYGSCVANIGDLNDDGVTDLFVGSQLEDDSFSSAGVGYVHFMNTNGSIDSTVKINATTTNGPALVGNSNYGAGCAGIGDLNNDGVEDIAVGANFATEGGSGVNAGKIYIHFMNTNATIDSTVVIQNGTANVPTLSDDDWYGTDVEHIGDFDGDGIEDIAVGAPRDDSSGVNAGATYLHFLNTDGTVKSTVKLNGSTANGAMLRAGDFYGTSVTLFDDLDADGAPDLIVGAPADVNFAQAPIGTIHVHYMHFVPTNFADLSLVTSVNDAAPPEGATITYTIVITNGGPDAATGVAVTDLLPAGVTYVSSTPSQGAYVNGTGVWTVGTVASGASATLTIDATINAGQTGNTITNWAEVSASGAADPDSTPGNLPTDEDDSDDAAFVVTADAADLSLTKMVDDPTPSVSQAITYTIGLSNAGPEAATGVVVEDVLPAGVTFVSDTPSQGLYDEGTGIWTVGTIANGGSASLAITVTVDTDQGGNIITNWAEVSASGVTDPDSSPNNLPTDEDDSDDAIITVDALSADLSLTKSVDDATPDVAQTITYTIAVANIGPNAATGVVVEDVLPAGVTFVSDTPSQGLYDEGTGIWTVGTIANGGSASLAITVTVDAGQEGNMITNLAEVSASGVADPDSTSNNLPIDEDDSDSSAVTVNQDLADLSLAKSVNDATPNELQVITYTLVVVNGGPNAATGVTVTDLLPAGVTYVAATPSQGTYVSGTGVWTVGTLANGANATLQIDASVDLGQEGNTITNTAEISASGVVDPDSTPGNSSNTEDDDDTIAVTVNVQPSITFNVGAQDDAVACGSSFAGNGGVIALGTIPVDGVVTSDSGSVDHICVRVSTNAAGGVTVAVQNANGANGLVSLSAPADDINSATGTIVAGTENYGICVGSGLAHTGRSAGAAVVRVSPFDGSCDTVNHVVGGLLATPQTLWTLAGPSIDAFAQIFVKSAISSITPAHSDYSDTLTFIVTPTY